MKMCEQCGHAISGEKFDWSGHSFDSRECMSAYQRDHGGSETGKSAGGSH